MITPGALMLKLKKQFGHGLGTAWQREVVRPRILKSQPVEELDDARCEIHVLTSEGDWLNLVWGLKSFYAASGRRYKLAIHEDKVLPAEAVDAFARLFPGSRLIRRTTADAAVLPSLEAYPRALALRRTNTLSMKVFDFRHFLEAERMFLFDSDILFFSEPKELLRRLEDLAYRKNSLNGDAATAYTVTPELARQWLNIDLPERINSGLGVLHAESLDLARIEECLALPGIIGHFWRIEQTLIALLSAWHGVELLPREYDVFLNGEVEARPSRHYVGAIRHLLYREGIAKLVRQGLLA